MIGQTISHYKILEKLGEGGMGIVYKAEDTKLKRTVALKFLPPGLTRDPEAKERFLHEAQAAAALEHQHICNIYEIDETEDQIFIVMSCFEGQTLKEKIESGPLKLDEALKEGKLAVELNPVSEDALFGPTRIEELAHIYVIVEEYDLAIDKLEHLLSIPSYISVPWLKLDPKWDPLRRHPKFQRLLEKYQGDN